MSNGTTQHPRRDPAPHQAPFDLPPDDDRGIPREAPDPDNPDDPAVPPSREPGPPPTSGVIPQGDADAAPAVDEEEAHVGATEEQIGDRTGPGVGYDQPEQKSRR